MDSRFKLNIIRLIVSMSIFAITIFFTPNFDVKNLYILLLLGIFVTIVDYVISTITNIHDYKIGRGVVGFFSFATIIYASQFFVSGYTISIISSFIASFIYASCDYFLTEN